MSKYDIVPAFWQGQNRRSNPAFLDSRINIKHKRKSGELQGWYQENGTVFIIHSHQKKEVDTLALTAGSSFTSAWAIRQSGSYGPLVWQMKSKGVHS